MEAKIIKTLTEYEAALETIDRLMDADPGSQEEQQLELLSLLVEKYEEQHYPIDPPDPVEAIKFRLEQEGLSRKDMIKYLGSQSKVSEVLNYKRPLSLSMIRSLNEGLGIPAEVLLQEVEHRHPAQQESCREYPFAEMIKHGYFPGFKGTLAQAKANADQLLAELFSVFDGAESQMIYTTSQQIDLDLNALRAWQARVLHLAAREDLPAYVKNEITEDFVREIVKLSYFSLGPQMARELLNKKGVHFILLPHLSGTYLDGDCFYATDERPVIGMTLRHDRLDNFWFTLVHELAHLYLHLDHKEIAFFDDTEYIMRGTTDPREEEASAFARDVLIPPQEWQEQSKLFAASGQDELLLAFAEQLKISPAIVAGRVRYETGDYGIYSRQVGSRIVREQFAGYGCR
ncbi:MAG: ImmA/IrrE family metallo-endopeptidase [Chloroflexota bacterium]|nr:ImmA/IrrE family metallo-endopeptidase [Chloroflexota bacterium]